MHSIRNFWKGKTERQKSRLASECVVFSNFWVYPREKKDLLLVFVTQAEYLAGRIGTDRQGAVEDQQGMQT